MSELKPEILLEIFKELSSEQMVNVTRVCKDWLEIINENKSLWRTLVLPKREKGWEISVVQLFNRKSQNNLTEVSLQPRLTRENINLFMNYIENSGRTLRTLALFQPAYNGMLLSILSQIPWKLPFLVDCRILCSNYNKQKVKLSEGNENKTPESERNEISKSTSLKILWIHKFGNLPHNRIKLKFLESLSSLWIDGRFKQKEWRKILETPSLTLKHLRGRFGGSRADQLLSLQFLQLKVLEFEYDANQIFPSWMIIPLNSTLIILSSGIPSFLPPVSTLWISNFRYSSNLDSRCPLLKELRIESESSYSSNKKLLKKFFEMLKRRKEKVEVGVELNGVGMIHLQKIVVHLKKWNSENLEKLKGLVEEVVDLESVSRFVEVEI